MQQTQRDAEAGSLSRLSRLIYRSSNGTAVFSIISTLIVVGFLSTPGAVHAGIFEDALRAISSTVSAWAGNKSASSNVQTMVLPAPATNIDPQAATGGASLTILDGSALLSEEGPSGTAANITAPQSSAISVYVVREGDTLSGIADMFDVSINTIRWSNDLGRGDTIRPGQTLTILPITGVKHVVKKGDTLASIAKKYDGDATEISNFNALEKGGTLAVGTEIIIPNGVVAAPVSAPSRTTVRVSTPAVSASVSADGYFIRPVANAVRTQGIHGYNGVDLAAGVGTPIVAAAPGNVIIARSSGWNGGYGIYAVIKHGNGTQTLYAHMSQINVVSGEYVTQGEVIGYVGNTGLSTGPHLHFEVRGARNPF